jgi:hypothetical protein
LITTHLEGRGCRSRPVNWRTQARQLPPNCLCKRAASPDGMDAAAQSASTIHSCLQHEIVTVHCMSGVLHM